MFPRDTARATSFALVVIAVAAIFTYRGSFAGGFVSDDVDAVANNPLLRSLDLENLRRIATSFDDANYIPLKVLSLAVDYQVWGLEPFGYHLTNLALHVADAFLVYFLVRRLGESTGLATAAALLWALHPTQVESVAWISERKNVLSTFFFLSALHAYLSFTVRPRARTYMLLLVLHLAALLSKVNTIVLPALTLAYEIVFRRRCRPRDVLATLPLLACGVAVAWVNLHDNPTHGVAYHGGSFEVTMRSSITTIPRYLANVVTPFHLMSYYPVPLRGSWLDPAVMGSVALVVAAIALTLWCALRGLPEGFWLAWFGITLAPMLNFVPFPALMNDRYLYLPLIGVLVVLLRAARRILRAVGGERFAPATVAAIALGLAVLTTMRIPVFHDPLSLWADMALRTSYITADQPYGGAARTEEKRLLAEAVAQNPGAAWLHNNIGGIAFEDNRMPDALASLTRAYELDPHDPVIALNLGRTYLRVGRIDDAIRTLEVAIALEPPSFFAHLNLARAYLLKGDLLAARAELTRAKAIKTDAYFWQSVEQALVRAERRGT